VSIEARLRLLSTNFDLQADFTAPGRGVTALFGPSGCGKSTLLRAMAGLEPAATGVLKIGNETWQDDTRMLPTHERPLGYVFQEADLFSHLSVQKNLEYGFRRTPTSRRQVSFDDVTELLGLQRLLDRPPERLSGGERQRVAIGRALLTSPRLLLLDEPLAALDDESKTNILPYLDRIHDDLEIPVMYVSHARDEVARLADHMILMDKGRITASGSISKLMTRLDLPLARDPEAETMIEAEVVGHDEEYGLMQVEFAGGRFTVSSAEIPIGARVRLRIRARDVSLTLERQTSTSILNIFSADVNELVEVDTHQVVVRLDMNGTALLARLTRKSAAALAIRQGLRVFAQIKSVAVVA